MATSGNLLLEEFIVNDNSQDVHDWIERFELKTDLLIFESSAKLPDDETKRDQAVERLKRMYLLSSVGKDGYKLLKSLSWPDHVRDKSYEDLKRLLQTKLAPPVNTASEQYKFSLCKQEESECLSAFLTRLKDKASLCAYGDQFQNMVINRFICGIRSSGIRMQLLSSCEETTTVDRIFELAVMKEQANLDNNVMATVNVVDRQRQNSKPHGNQFNQTNKNYQRSKRNLNIRLFVDTVNDQDISLKIVENSQEKRINLIMLKPIRLILIRKLTQFRIATTYLV